MKPSERMEQDADSWYEKNEGVEVPKECSGDYAYGYNAGCAETFRACAYRTVALEFSLAAKDAEIARLREALKFAVAKIHSEFCDLTDCGDHCSSCKQIYAALAETPAEPDAAIIGPDGKGSATQSTRSAGGEVMDSNLRELISGPHRYDWSPLQGTICRCGERWNYRANIMPWDQWLAHIESLEGKQTPAAPKEPR